MTSPTVRNVSESFVKPLHDLSSSDAKQPIYFTPFELVLLNLNYTQKGLLFAKPENQDFSITTFLDDLRNSLSATLTHFYPLAARLAIRKQENPPSFEIFIDPKNSTSGVKFIYAIADATISDLLNPPQVPSLVHSLFDLNNSINHDGYTLPLLSIQVTELADGIFIGGSINHLIADGTSFWYFMSAWSKVFRSKGQDGSYVISNPPVFKRCALEVYDPIINLPYTHEDEFIERPTYPHVKERFFHFSSASVSRLKSKANFECNMEKISSLQAVCGVLWRCVTRVRGLPPKSETVCKLVINNRRKLNPPLPDDYFGSPISSVRGTASVEDLMAHGLGWAACRLHEAVTNHNDTTVRIWLESWLRNPIVYKINGMFPGNSVSIVSSPRFDMYGCEFGLGKAIATRSGLANKFDGKMTMYPGREGGGSMDVEICLLPEYMMKLECDQEFISARLNRGVKIQ